MRTEDGYIIYKCLNDDTGAFGLLVDKYKAGVYALAYSKLRNFHDAEDIAQEVFIRAYENLHKLRRWERFASWLYRITSSLCMRFLRARSRRPDGEFIEDGEPGLLESHTMDSYRDRLVFESIHEALDSLPETHQQVLILHYFGGMTSAEIAGFAGVSAAAVRKRLSKARSLMKAEILTDMSAAFQERKLSAGFTLRVAEIVRHIRVKPIPRLTELPWGASIGIGVLAVFLCLGLFAGLYNSLYCLGPAALKTTKRVDTDEISVDIIEQTVAEREGDIGMLDRRQIALVSIITAILGGISGNTMAQQAFFSDNFEDADVSDWRAEYYSGQIDIDGFNSSPPETPIVGATADSASSGNFGMRYTKDQQLGNGIAVNSPAFGPLSDKIQVDLDFIPDNHNHVFWLSELAPFETHNESQVAQCGISIDQGGICLRASEYPMLGYYDPGKFYHLTIVADVSANTFDVEMIGDLRDLAETPVGVLKATDLVFERSATSISRITLFTGSNASLQPTLGVDNVIIRQPYTMELRDSTGELIQNSGAIIKYQPNSSGAYIDFGDGLMDADGTETAGIPDGRHRFRLTYQDCTQEKQQDVGENPVVTYQTVLVTVKLKDSTGNLIQNSGATVMWQSGSSGPYADFGDGALDANGTETMEVLPLRHRFRLTYQACTQEKQQNVGSDPVVVYQTHLVTVELRDGNGDLILDSDAIIRYQPGSSGSYMDFGDGMLDADGDEEMEVLPRRHRYRMTYNGETKEQQSDSTPVTFYSTIFAAPMALRNYLLPNFPNPFNPETWIPYGLGEDADVSIKIHSASGQLVRMLNLGHKPAGFYSNKSEAAYWDGTNDSKEPVASGVYFYTIQAGEFAATRKMLMMK